MNPETQTAHEKLSTRLRRKLGLTSVNESREKKPPFSIQEINIPSFGNDPAYDLRVVSDVASVDKASLLPAGPHDETIVEHTDPHGNVSYVVMESGLFYDPESTDVESYPCTVVKSPSKGVAMKATPSILGNELRGTGFGTEDVYLGKSRRLLFLRALDQEAMPNVPNEGPEFQEAGEWALKIRAVHDAMHTVENQAA